MHSLVCPVYTKTIAHSENDVELWERVMAQPKALSRPIFLKLSAFSRELIHHLSPTMPYISLIFMMVARELQNLNSKISLKIIKLVSLLEFLLFVDMLLMF